MYNCQYSVRKIEKWITRKTIDVALFYVQSISLNFKSSVKELQTVPVCVLVASRSFQIGRASATEGAGRAERECVSQVHCSLKNGLRRIMSVES